jgi:hypothetical protein
MQAPLIQVIFKIFMQGPLREDFRRISTTSAHRDPYKIMQEPLRGFHQAHPKSFSQALQDLGKEFQRRTSKSAL